uniref:Uncharacterized protein n=1 Tax=Glossina pallidipes TaxID=7398 RepID=A0A1A9Z2H8_GLOPL
TRANCSALGPPLSRGGPAYLELILFDSLLVTHYITAMVFVYFITQCRPFNLEVVVVVEGVVAVVVAGGGGDVLKLGWQLSGGLGAPNLSVIVLGVADFVAGASIINPSTPFLPPETESP